MKSQLVSLLLVVLAMIGIADAGYISYEEIRGITPTCSPGFSCAQVLDSPYAKIGPIPIAYLGLIYYLISFALAVGWVLELKLPQALRKRWPKLDWPEILTLTTAFGFAFSLYLVLLMAVIIKGWCQYCLISAVNSSLLFLLICYYNLMLKKESYIYIKGLMHGLVGFFYQKLIKPVAFLLDAEQVHNLAIAFGKFLGSSALTKHAVAAKLGFNHQLANKKVLGITFPNPVGLAAGFDYNGQLTQILPAVGFGWHTIGTVTWNSYSGNPKPRLGRFPQSRALLVNKGLKSWGAKKVLEYLLHQPLTIPTAISIASTNQHFENDRQQIMDMMQTFRLFEDSKLKHHLYELNISCPNTFGGEPFTTPSRLKLLLEALGKLKLSRPVLVKMPIDQSEADTLALLKVIDKHQIAGLIFGNLTKDKNNPSVTKNDQAAWKKQKGNLSGKPTWERSLNLLRLAKSKFGKRFVLVGTGGIFTPEDALAKLAAGADLLQLITGMIYQGPQLPGQISRQLVLEKLKSAAN